MNELNTYITSDIPVLANNLRQFITNETNKDVGFEPIVQILSDIAEISKKEHLELSRTRPDFESIKLQFQAKLRQTDAWRDLIQAGVGETILEFVAAIGDYAQTSILRAYQETSMDARLTSSVYSITRILGVHIPRKIPATVTIQLWGEEFDSLGDLTIPRLSQFAVGGIPCFNREPIVFNNNTQDKPLTTTLYQGNVTIEKFLSTGTPFQSMEVGQNDYRIADEDIYCFIDDSDEYKRDTAGPWHLGRSDKKFYENTLPGGNAEILFGNSVFGKVPNVDSIISVVYVLTDGEDGNTSVTNKPVNLLAINDSVPDRIKGDNASDITDQLTKNLVGVSITGLFNGGDERDKDFLKLVAPGIRASNGRMVSRPDHFAQGLLFGDIVDVYFQGQRELGRNRPSKMNLVGVTALKKNGEGLDEAEWDQYVAYLTKLEIWRANFIKINPEPIDFDVYGDIYMAKESAIANVGSWARNNAINFFKPQLGSLGKSVFENDISGIMKVRYGDMYTDYVENLRPSVRTRLTKIQWPRLRSFDCKVDYSDRQYRSLGYKELEEH